MKHWEETSTGACAAVWELNSIRICGLARALAHVSFLISHDHWRHMCCYSPPPLAV